MDPIIENEYELDYLAYQQIYDQYANLERKPRTQATMAGKIDHNGPPLDFSFLKLQDVANLSKERPRGGKRKPIPKSPEENETQKTDLNGLGNEGEKVDGGEQKDTKKDLVIRNTSVP